ncbi:esterase OVCA2 isoform X1 [Petromyzon marinus]|uniref:esterase OVCA2 isoform X1 n=1 Tax=Petromyzon marinus TaxID=7757 RepID=UPI003F707916
MCLRSRPAPPGVALLAMAAERAASPPLLRILCLHGYRQNGKSFRDRTGSLRKILKKHAELVYISAPNVIPAQREEEEAAGGDGDTHTDDQRAWWFTVDPARAAPSERLFDSTAASAYSVGFDDSVLTIARTVNELGPFHEPTLRGRAGEARQGGVGGDGAVGDAPAEVADAVVRQAGVELPPARPLRRDAGQGFPPGMVLVAPQGARSQHLTLLTLSPHSLGTSLCLSLLTLSAPHSLSSLAQHLTLLTLSAPHSLSPLSRHLTLSSLSQHLSLLTLSASHSPHSLGTSLSLSSLSQHLTLSLLILSAPHSLSPHSLGTSLSLSPHSLSTSLSLSPHSLGTSLCLSFFFLFFKY